MTWYCMKLAYIRFIFPNQKIYLAVSSAWLVALVVFGAWINCLPLYVGPLFNKAILSSFFNSQKYSISRTHGQATRWLLRVSWENWQCYKEYILCYTILCTVWCFYNALTFLQYPHERHPIAHLSGWTMEFLFVPSNSRFIFYINHCSDICDIMKCWTMFAIIIVMNNVLCWYLQCRLLPIPTIHQAKIYVMLEVFPKLFIIHNTAIWFWILDCLMHTLAMTDCRKIDDQLGCKKICVRFLYNMGPILYQ